VFSARGKEAWCNALLDAGADPNIQNASGSTPLLLLLHQGLAGRIAHNLLANGADPTLKNHAGISPDQLLSKRDYPTKVLPFPPNRLKKTID
jgi:ankyrin repeat protein